MLLHIFEPALGTSSVSLLCTGVKDGPIASAALAMTTTMTITMTITIAITMTIAMTITIAITMTITMTID